MMATRMPLVPDDEPERIPRSDFDIAELEHAQRLQRSVKEPFSLLRPSAGACEPLAIGDLDAIREIEQQLDPINRGVGADRASRGRRLLRPSAPRRTRPRPTRLVSRRSPSDGERRRTERPVWRARGGRSASAPTTPSARKRRVALDARLPDARHGRGLLRRPAAGVGTRSSTSHSRTDVLGRDALHRARGRTTGRQRRTTLTSCARCSTGFRRPAAQDVEASPATVTRSAALASRVRDACSARGRRSAPRFVARARHTGRSVRPPPPVGMRAARDPGVSVEVAFDEERRRRSPTSTRPPRVRAPSPVDWSRLLDLPDGVEVADGDAARRLRLKAGAERTVSFTLRCTRWACSSSAMSKSERGIRSARRLGRAHPGRHHLKTYPSEVSLRRTLSPVETQCSRSEVARVKGDGIEYADIRDFVPGPRPLVWRASARRRELVVNERHPSATRTSCSSSTASSTSQHGRACSKTRSGRQRRRDQVLERRDRVGLVSFGGILRWLQPGWASHRDTG